MSKKVGYIPGQGRTFTPSLNANWTNEFAEILEREKISRNALTEELIELGLRFKRNDHLLISTENLTTEQISLLSSKEGQQILLNVALMLIGQPTSILNVSNVEQSEFVSNPPLDVPKQNQIDVKQPAYKEEETTNTLESPSRISNDVKTPLNKNEGEESGRKLSAKEKLRIKMNMLNQSKENLN